MQCATNCKKNDKKVNEMNTTLPLLLALFVSSQTTFALVCVHTNDIVMW